MSEPLTCAALAAAVVKQPAPIVFLDTAAILDVLRVPFRHDLQADIFDSALSATKDGSANPKRVWLITSANVVRELETRRQSVESELNGYISSMQQAVGRVLTVVRRTFPDRRFQWPNLMELGFSDRVVRVMDLLIGATSVFSGGTGCIKRASARIWAGAPPASRGSQQYKDCEIFEEFIEFVSTIRSEGFEPPVVFVTPNKNDYGRPPDGHPRIASDLARIRAHYAANLSWARASISSG